MRIRILFKDCVENTFPFRIVVNMGGKYKAGVPELALPALDPLVVRRR